MIFGRFPQDIGSMADETRVETVPEIRGGAMIAASLPGSYGYRWIRRRRGQEPVEEITLEEDESVTVRVVDDTGNPVLHSPGDYNVIVPGHRDIEHRSRVLDEAGVDMQVLSFTAPGTSLETPERAAALAPVINDALAKIKDERKDRFTALAHLPMNNPPAAVPRRARGPRLDAARPSRSRTTFTCFTARRRGRPRTYS